MGIMKAAVNSVTGTLKEQWKEYFYCEAIPSDVLALKGMKKTSGFFGSNKGSDNVISNGSVIAVADGQCVVIVEQGKVVDLCAEPGEYVYDVGSEPSLFGAGSLSENLAGVFASMGKRFTFGGGNPKDQRVYYFNTKEIIGCKFGTVNPVPFRVVDARAGIDMDVGLRCFGEYTFRLTNPILFYTNVCGNVSSAYSVKELESQMRSELLTALQPAFARISDMGIRYSSVPGHTAELAEALKTELSAKWRDYRGIEIQSVGVSSVNVKPEDEQMIQDLQRSAAFMDPTRAAAYRVAAEADAMKAAANNANGAAMGFLGMNMAANAGGTSTQNLYAMGQQQAAQQAASSAWKCPNCGNMNEGKFCAECGNPKPSKCSCGWEVKPGERIPKFCPECGKPFGK